MSMHSYSSHNHPIGQPNTPFSTQDGKLWQEVSFYEQHIVRLELLLTQLTQYEQLCFTYRGVDASVQIYYTLIKARYITQIERAYHLREGLLMRLL